MIGLAALTAIVALLIAAAAWRARRQAHAATALVLAEARVMPVALALVDEESAGALALAEALTPSDRRVLAEQLVSMGPHLRGGAGRRITEYFESENNLAPYLRALSARRVSTRFEAAGALGAIGSHRGVGPLIAALADPDPDVRAAAARSLGALRATEAAEALMAGMADRSLSQVVATTALTAIGASAVPAIRDALGSGAPEIRGASARLLGLVGDASDIPALIPCLQDPAASVRTQCAAALGRIGDAQAAAALRPLLADRIATVRVAAEQALAHLAGLLGPAALELPEPAPSPPVTATAALWDQ